MTKHIHIYLHRTPAKARDAGFDESKHKRDHGKFSTTSGGAAHHEAQAQPSPVERAKAELAKPNSTHLALLGDPKANREAQRITSEANANKPIK